MKQIIIAVALALAAGASAYAQQERSEKVPVAVYYPESVNTIPADAAAVLMAKLNAATTRMVGLTAYSCVQQLTAQCAAAVLAATDAPIADIVVRLGYSSPTFFTRFFRENMGCTPTAWRKQQALATPGAM